MTEKKPLISELRGKFQAVGVLFAATGIITSVIGMWWGPAVLLPGLLLLIMGWL